MSLYAPMQSIAATPLACLIFLLIIRYATAQFTYQVITANFAGFGLSILYINRKKTMIQFPSLRVSSGLVKQGFILVFAIVTFQSNMFAQLEKRNWLIGGNAGFSSNSYQGNGISTYRQSNLEISPTVGLFVADNFAVGLRPSYTHVSTTLGSTPNTSVNIYGIGPFARYYFLEKANRTNIFAEVSYKFASENVINNPSTITNGFGILAGPVVFLNPNVGMEFTVGYKRTMYNGSDATANGFQVGVGLQVYLERTKSL